ncbi:M1 family metallopeptidase [Brevundimonas sp. Leaf363]|uniref:M1 family metallopeptidase n=1 Tax=Brevundimonas sp. Leaf363 TaxID=1736353 RepID=UPI001F18EFB0|nr:M1 family metallopeptidase [Brevundimonas sp. Leaf363]
MSATSLLVLAACASTPESATPAAATPAELSTPFTLTTGSPRTPEQQSVRFEKADLAIRVMPDSQSIDAVAVLDVTAAQPVDRLVFELDTRLPIRSIVINGRPLTTAEWSNPDGRLTIVLPQTLAAGRGASVRIAYGGHPRTAPQAPWDGGFVWSAAPNGQPWIATAVQGEGCDLFWPCIDHPLGEPGRVDLHITVPTGLMAPSNGRFIGSVDHGDGWTTWTWSAREPNTYAIALNIGPYVEMQADHVSRYGATIPLRFWPLSTDDPAKAQGLFDQFPRMMDFYEATVGPFPFGDDKMGVVETPHLGMEHQTINAYGNAYRLDGKDYDWLLHHELAHEWFGNQMTDADYDDLWLHEGLGSYMQPLYARWLNGDRAMQVELSEMRGKLINRFPLVSGRPQDDDSVYDSARGPGLDLYNKGALVAHSLRLLIGDHAFFETIRRLVYGTDDPRPGQFEPRFGTTAEFEALASRAAGRDLGWFFDVYLHQAALPELRQTRAGDRIVLEWITEGGRPFPMPLEVEVEGRVQTLSMTGGRGELVAPAGAHILIDPQNKVLRRLEHIEAWQAARAAPTAPK